MCVCVQKERVHVCSKECVCARVFKGVCVCVGGVCTCVRACCVYVLLCMCVGGGVCACWRCLYFVVVVPSSGQRCRLPTEDYSTILGVRLWPAEPRKRQNAQVLVWSKPGKTHSGKSKGCEILGECGPRKPHATSDSETSARWKRADGHDSSRCHHSHPGSRQQPGSHAGLALAKVATVGPPANPATSSAGRRGRAATGTRGVGAVNCDNCRTAPAAFPPNRSHGNEKRRQRGRRVRRTRWFLLTIWRKRGSDGRSPWRAKIQLCQTYAVVSGVEGGAVLRASRRVFVAFGSCAVLSRIVHASPTVNTSQGFARMVEQFSEKGCLFFVVSKGFGAAFTSKSLHAQYRPVRIHVTVFKEHGPVIFTSGSFGDVFVNLLFAQYRPGWMHLLATANYPRAMCLKNCIYRALGLFKAIQRNVGCFLLSTKIVVLLLPANHCLLIGYTSQISRSLALFMLLAEVSVPFLSFCCPTFSVKVGSTCTQQSGLPG